MKMAYILPLMTTLLVFTATHANADINDTVTRTFTKKAILVDADTKEESTLTPIFYGRSSRYPFSSAVRLGDTLYLSGQICLKDGKLVEGGIKAETKQALDNVNALLVKYGYQKTDLVNCTAMLVDLSKFGEFNEAYTAGLSKPYPKGTLFGIDEPLILGASVELECSAKK